MPTNELGKRADYLIECFRTARSEMLTRIQNRDRWLMLQLLGQAVLYALSMGIPFLNIGNASQKSPELLDLAFPISLMLAIFYSVEDALVAWLSRYIGSLSTFECDLHRASIEIHNWDGSAAFRPHVLGAFVRIRLIGQLIAFTVIPAYIAMPRFKDWWFWGWVTEASAFLFTVAIILFGLWIRRRKLDEPKTRPNQALQRTAPRSGA